MWRSICVLLLVSSCFADDLDVKEHWGKFKSTFKKKFENKKHEDERKDRFEKKVKMILKHNLEADLGLHSFKLGINKFTDLSEEEFASKHLGVRMPKNVTKNYPPKTLKAKLGSPPANFDWRDMGVVTSVKDQGNCRTCWAFGSAAAVESALALKTGNLIDLSEQQLVDCVGSHAMGCQLGGWPNEAYEYLKNNGLETASCLPYADTQNQCSVNSNCVQTKLSSYYDVPKDEEIMKKMLYDYGPMTVVIYASDKIGSYMGGGGVLSDDNCDKTVNHVVTVVGYGTENGQDYWTIKNSWGTWWGDKGYMKLARNANGMCGIDKYASFPII